MTRRTSHRGRHKSPAHQRRVSLVGVNLKTSFNSGSDIGASMRSSIGQQLINRRNGIFPFRMDDSPYSAIGVFATFCLEPMLVVTVDAIAVA